MVWFKRVGPTVSHREPEGGTGEWLGPEWGCGRRRRRGSGEAMAMAKMGCPADEETRGGRGVAGEARWRRSSIAGDHHSPSSARASPVLASLFFISMPFSVSLKVGPPQEDHPMLLLNRNFAYLLNPSMS